LNQELQELQELQEFRSSGVQEFRSSGVQEFRSSGVQELFLERRWQVKLLLGILPLKRSGSQILQLLTPELLTLTFTSDIPRQSDSSLEKPGSDHHCNIDDAIKNRHSDERLVPMGCELTQLLTLARQFR